MKMLNFIILIILVTLLSCKRNIQEKPPDLSIERIKKKEALIQLNKYVVRRNQDLIERFVERTEPEMKKTGTGLWYHINSPGNGEPVKNGKIIEYSYSVKLLDGTRFDSVPVRQKIMKVGQGGVESGLEEALLLLREGDHARFIIPPHLAHGNSGDGAKIPPGAVIIYDIDLINVRN